MNHPFDLDAAELEAMDLDFGEPLTDEEAAHIRGGTDVTTLAVGEEGGCRPIQCISAPCPGSEGGGGSGLTPIDDWATTQAIGEEGGGSGTQPWWEGGGGPIY